MEINLIHQTIVQYPNYFSSPNILISIMSTKLFYMGIFVGLKKSFDTVGHTILMKKINYYGVRGVSNDF